MFGVFLVFDERNSLAPPFPALAPPGVHGQCWSGVATAVSLMPGVVTVAHPEADLAIEDDLVRNEDGAPPSPKHSL